MDLTQYFIPGQISLHEIIENIGILDHDVVYEFMKKLDLYLEDYDGSLDYCKWLLKSLHGDSESTWGEFIQSIADETSSTHFSNAEDNP